MKIDHIGYVTSDFDKTLKYFRDQLNMRQITNKIKEPAHGVDVIFLDMGQKGYPALEIIRPNNKKSKVSNFLKKNGDGIHHLAFEVSNVEKKIIELKKKIF